MRISLIKLENFRSYRNQTFEFPPSKDGRNLILIGGLNGFGKTSILEAIYLGLYGSEAVKYLGRAGLKFDDQVYQKFVSKVFHGNADHDSPMCITIDFVDDDGHGYSVNRNWYFDKNRFFSDEDLRIARISHSVKEKNLNKDSLTEILGNYFVPANIASFFFFDGEEIKSLARKDKMEIVKTAIDSFLGIVVLRDLQKRLREYQNARSRGISESDPDKLEKLYSEKGRIETTIQDLERKQSEYESSKNQIDIEWGKLHERMLTLGGSDGKLQNVKDLAEKINDYKNSLEKLRNELCSLVCNKLSLNLVSPSLLDELLQQSSRELATRDWEHECQLLKPQREKFLKNFEQFDNCEPALNENQKQQIIQSICNAWEAMFFPPPANCETNCHLTYLHNDHLKKLPDIYNSIKLDRMEFENKLEDILLKEKHLESYKKQMSRLEGYDQSGDLVNKLRNEYKLLTEKRDEIVRNINTIKNELTAEKSNLTNISAEYSRERQRCLDNAPVADKVKKAERVYDFINKLIINLYPLKKEILQDEITKVFKALSHKENVYKITIDDDATAHLWGKNGQELDFDQSAGESQLFATALIAALANISREGAPLVVDTPLGRLDSLHRENILKLWVSDPKRQVILLSQDEEITPEQYIKLKPHILKSYILTHLDMGEGIGQTTACEGYFGS